MACCCKFRSNKVFYVYFLSPDSYIQHNPYPQGTFPESAASDQVTEVEQWLSFAEHLDLVVMGLGEC